MLPRDRRESIAALGGATAVSLMPHEARAVTVNDLYAFDADAVVSIDPFRDIIGRHFKQPKEGPANDNTPALHMWRTLANPDAPL